LEHISLKNNQFWRVFTVSKSRIADQTSGYYFRSIAISSGYLAVMLSRFTNKDFRLGDLLLESGLITQGQLGKAVSQQRASGLQLGQILISQGLISSRQLNRTLRQQRWMRRMAWVVAFVCAPFNIATARDLVSQPVQLPSWDAPLAAQFNGFKCTTLQDAMEPRNEYTPISLSLTNLHVMYRAVTGSNTPITLPAQFEPQVERIMYNVEMAVGGGLRVNLQYRF
jgi:hypothetical protein